MPSAMVAAAAMVTGCACLARPQHRRQFFRFHADHANFRIAFLQGAAYAANQAAAADRHHDRLNVRHLFQQFQPDGSLAGDHLRVVERMNQRAPFLIPPPHRLFAGFVIAGAVQNHFGPKRTRRRNLHQWRRERHHDLRANASAVA